MNVYLDTNAFFYLFFENSRYSKGAKEVFAKIQNGEYHAVTSCFTLEELAYIMAMKLLEQKYKKHPHAVLREKPETIKECAGQIRATFTVIYSMDNLEIVGSDKAQMWFITDCMEEHALLPRDAIHMQTMKENNIRHIVSTDNDFDRVQGVERIWPGRK